MQLKEIILVLLVIAFLAYPSAAIDSAGTVTRSLSASSAALSASQAPVDLGTAGNFVILTKSGISTTGTTSIVGNIGVSPVAATYITGFGLIADASNEFSTSSLVTGKVYASNYAPPTPTMMSTAVSDMEIAFIAGNAPAPTVTELGAGEIGGMTLAPGVYKWSTGVLISTDVTLSGSSTDVWIFQIAQTLDLSNGKQVILSGDADAKNIFWVVSGQTTLGTTSVMNGNILDQTAIVLNNGATLNGRALAQTAVTLDANAVALPEALIPVAITIVTPSNGSTNTTGNINVTVTLGSNGTVQYLKWQDQIYTITPNISQPSGTVFYSNITGLLSGNYSFKVYATGSDGGLNVSETRTITVNLTNTTNYSSSINSTTGNLSADIILISPSRNATVTIFNGTNATVNGITLGTVSIDSPIQINATVAGLDRFVGENVTLGPTEARFIPDIQMRFNYTAAQLTAAGITDAGTLRIRFYNTTTGSYVILTTSTLDTTGRYIIANATRFGTFALVGTAPTPPGDHGSSGGSGIGSARVISSKEPSANIASAQANYFQKLQADKQVSFNFSNPKTAITGVSFTPLLLSSREVEFKVEQLKSRSGSVSANVSGKLYVYANIILGLSAPKEVKDIKITFDVDNEWMKKNGVQSSDIALYRWNDDKWTALATTHTGADSKNTYFSANVPGLLSFAISTKDVTSSVIESPVIESPVGESPKKSWTGILILLVIIAIAAIAYYASTKKSGQQK